MLDKDLLRVMIHEIFHAIEDAEAGKSLIVAILKIVENVGSSDLVLDKIISLLSAKGINVASMAAHVPNLPAMAAAIPK